MSLSKKNWSALSSLARQRSMEDDEEFEKARRRRTRMNSLLTDNEGIPEEQYTSENSSKANEQEVTTSPAEDEPVEFAEILKRREEDKRRYQRETLQSMKLARFGSESEADEGSKSERGNENEKPEMKGVPSKTPEKQTEGYYSRSPSASSLKEKETNSRSASMQNHSDTGNTGHQSPLSPLHTTRAFISLGKPKEDKSPTKLKKQPSLERNSCPWGEYSSTKAESDRHRSQTKSTEIKGKEREGYAKLREDAPKQETKNNARLQDEQSGVQQEKKENIPDGSGTNSSPFRRFSPRAASFRATDPEVKSQSLRRSASLRIPARSSSGKIDGILEKYAKAIERSDSIKSKSSPSDYLSRPLEGVASKRCVFEKDTQNSSSRFLMTRKDIRPGDVASKRSLWENKADSVEKV